MWYGPALRVVLVLALLGAAAAPRPVHAKAVVTDLRVGHTAFVTRVVLHFTERVRFKVFTLADPDRVVVDLPEVGWRLPPRALPARIGLLATLRYGLFRKGTSRLVLDVTGPVAVGKAFLLKPERGGAWRLVIDLVEGAGATSRAAARRSPSPVVAPTVAKPQAVKPTAALAFPIPPHKPERPLPKRVIVIDPGHGGVDPGTIGVSGVYEKHITLLVARAIQRRLQRGARYRVVLSRERDVFVRLRERVVLAREAGADLFISLHADAIRDGRIRGLSVYTLSEKASDKEAALLAEKENRADLLAGIDLSKESPEVSDILFDLAQRETMNQSTRFATHLVKALARQTRLLRNTHRFAGFAVLKAPDVPSVLLELGFLSNRYDERSLMRKAYRAKLAAAVERAVGGYFDHIEEAARR